jgi:uncharacterized protein (TIGR00251 family)
VPPVPFLRETSGGTLLSVKLQPRASKNEIGEALGAELKIKVTAPPVDAAANQALVELLADILGCSRGQVEIIRGHTSRHKTLMLHKLTPEIAAQKLASKNAEK